MFRELKIKDADGQEVTMGFTANGATALRYRLIFGKDLIKELTKLLNDTKDGLGDLADFSVVDELAYIMNLQHQKADFSGVNKNSFIEWLETLETCAFLANYGDVIGIYLGNKETLSNPKKEDAQ